MLPQIPFVLLDEIVVLISSAFAEVFTVDEQDVIGNFFSSLGAITLLNSSYLGYIQTLQSQEDKEEHKDHYELLEKSIDRIKEELEKIKKEKQ